MFSIIAIPFGYLMRGLYYIFSNYALSIIFFTIIIRLLLLPLSIKQQKSQTMMARMRPFENKIRQKYKSDPMKAREEINALYQSEGYSPYSGCLTALIQLPIFIGLYEVIRYPLHYIAGVANDLINALPAVEGVSTLDMYYAGLPQASWNAADFAKISGDSLFGLPLNLKLFGLDLTQTASFGQISVYWLFPLLSGLTALLMQLITMKINQRNAGGEKQPGMGMMLFMPIFSVVIGFSVPSALVFYWCVSNVVLTVQTIILGRYYTVERVMRIRAKKKAKKGEAITREEANILIKNEDYTVEEVGPKSAKELKEEAKRKLAEARRREEEEWRR
ncbi:MAG: membrane protein insertase YidC [Clostridia bacterium]|nr:membrane protein insertase YidC [Clostridia bacterium]